jgi:hypothetical protein
MVDGLLVGPEQVGDDHPLDVATCYGSPYRGRIDLCVDIHEAMARDRLATRRPEGGHAAVFELAPRGVPIRDADDPNRPEGTPV